MWGRNWILGTLVEKCVVSVGNCPRVTRALKRYIYIYINAAISLNAFKCIHSRI